MEYINDVSRMTIKCEIEYSMKFLGFWGLQEDNNRTKEEMSEEEVLKAFLVFSKHQIKRFEWVVQRFKKSQSGKQGQTSTYYVHIGTSIIPIIDEWCGRMLDV